MHNIPRLRSQNIVTVQVLSSPHLSHHFSPSFCCLISFPTSFHELDSCTLGSVISVELNSFSFVNMVYAPETGVIDLTMTRWKAVHLKCHHAVSSYTQQDLRFGLCKREKNNILFVSSALLSWFWSLYVLKQFLNKY